MAATKIEWKALEHHHEEKSNDWFWATGIVTVGIAVLSVYFNNLLFAILILLAAFASILNSHTRPRILNYSLTRKGITVGKKLYPYSELESFWVIDEEVHDKILVRSKKTFMPLLVLPYDSSKTDPDEIADFLLDFLDEEEMDESLLQILMERLGF